MISISDAVSVLRAGGVIAIPTETVYGLAVNALDAKAVATLFSIKWRPDKKPISIQVWRKSDILKYAKIVDPKEQKIIDNFMPGAITLVLQKRNNVSDVVTAGLVYVGVRIPAHPDTLELLQSIDFPLAVPSANITGEKPAETAYEAEAIFGDKVWCYMPNHYPVWTIASTVVQIVDGEVQILREGPITKKEIESVL